MIRIENIKTRVQYEAKPDHPKCSTCMHFASDFVIPKWATEGSYSWDRYQDGTYAKEEKNIRCLAHGFAVKKTAVCKTWTKKEPT